MDSKLITTAAAGSLASLLALATPDDSSRDYADFDGDGVLDALTVGPEGSLTLLQGTDSGFTDVTAEAGLGNFPSVSQAHWVAGATGGAARILLLETDGRVRLLEGNGEGAFVDQSTEAGLGQEKAPGFDQVDLDGDGRTELVVLLSDGVRVFKRSTAGKALLPRSAVDSVVVNGTGSSALPSSSTVSSTLVGGGSAARSVGVCAGSMSDVGQPGACLQASSTPMLGHLFPLSQDLFVSPAGDVGVGTTSPGGALHVRGDRIYLEDPSTGDSIQMRTTGSALDIETQGRPLYVNNTSGEEIYLMGRVGVGTTSPARTLHVAGHIEADSGLHIKNTHVWSGQIDVRDGSSNITGVSLKGNDGEHTIRVMDANGAVSIRMNGMSGRTTTEVLEITGGSDLVEGFDTLDECEPGSVVLIAEEGDGRLCLSQSAYDSRVAGIVSGAGGVKAGLRLGQEGVLDGDTELAMVGRVWVKASAENGPISPGDLLTTADLPGHAMRATDPERSFGAILGKAMTSLDVDSGLVLVLVSLQ